MLGEGQSIPGRPPENNRQKEKERKKVRLSGKNLNVDSRSKFCGVFAVRATNTVFTTANVVGCQKEDEKKEQRGKKSSCGGGLLKELSKLGFT